VLVVGILGIMLGVFGVIGSAQVALMPVLMEFQKDFFRSIAEAALEEQQQETLGPKSLADSTCPLPKTGMSALQTMEMMERMWDVPEWFSWWCAVYGLVSLGICAFYVFGSVWFVLMKKRALKLFYWSLALTIGWALVEIAVSVFTRSFIAISMISGAAFWVIINAVILVIVISADKKVFVISGTAVSN